MRSVIDDIPTTLGVRMLGHKDRPIEVCLNCIKKSCNSCPNDEEESEYFKLAVKKYKASTS